jgi:hypothetical protein
MTDLRQAAQQALEAFEYASTGNRRPKIINEALAREHAMRGGSEQQAEPVAWMFQHDETGRMNYVSNDGRNTPDLFLKTNLRYALVCPLYAAPPQRPWVGLTDEEMGDIVADIDVDFGDLLWKVICLTKIIEAKLKELNK